MVKIRLARVGATNRPKYRVVVANEQSPRDGAFLEIIGYYDETVKPAIFELNKERFNHWTKLGAQASEAVAKLLTTVETK